MKSLNLKGHACVEGPLETHPFECPEGDDYYCKICHRPRALHESDGFTTKPGREMQPGEAMKPGWKGMVWLGKPLTDYQINRYQKRGYYSEQFREARREMWARKASKKGNFLELEGRLIYSPK